MSIADAAFGATQAIQRQKQQAAEEQKAVADLQQQLADMEYRRREGERANQRLGLETQRFDWDKQRQTGLDDRQATADRQKTNDQGVQRMVGELIRTQGITPQNRQQIVGTLVEAGRMPTADDLADPGAELQQEIAKAKAVGDINRANSLAEIAARGAEERRTNAAPHDRAPVGAQRTRGVTSGDANRMADYDSALSDLDALEKQLGTTGAASKLGTMLPNVVTEYTGIGTEAKSRQGTIDRVKQVIGKTLEGGVLRKEDEYKYTKILPTIGDPPPVSSAKLRGLRAAIQQRRETQLESLEDAGYDASRYRERANAGGGGGVEEWGRDATGKLVRVR